MLVTVISPAVSMATQAAASRHRRAASRQRDPPENLPRRAVQQGLLFQGRLDGSQPQRGNQHNPRNRRQRWTQRAAFHPVSHGWPLLPSSTILPAQIRPARRGLQVERDKDHQPMIHKSRSGGRASRCDQSQARAVPSGRLMARVSSAGPRMNHKQQNRHCMAD